MRTQTKHSYISKYYEWTIQFVTTGKLCQWISQLHSVSQTRQCISDGGQKCNLLKARCPFYPSWNSLYYLLPPFLAQRSKKSLGQGPKPSQGAIRWPVWRAIPTITSSTSVDYYFFVCLAVVNYLRRLPGSWTMFCGWYHTHSMAISLICKQGREVLILVCLSLPYKSPYKNAISGLHRAPVILYL